MITNNFGNLIGPNRDGFWFGTHWNGTVWYRDCWDGILGRNGMGSKIDELLCDGAGPEIEEAMLGRDANMVGRFGSCLGRVPIHPWAFMLKSLVVPFLTCAQP